MKLEIVLIDKTDQAYLRTGLDLYAKRLQHYCRLQITTLQSPAAWGKLKPEEIKQRQGEQLLKRVPPGQNVYRLDEGGEQLSSRQLAGLIEKEDLYGTGTLTLIIGGPYGFSHEAQAAYPKALSLSRMTFSHQMVRLILLEQLYRAFTIIRGEPYHHD
ncbi:MAG: 23S rRNA (pseudouridine(1915)-N(3))-methyltransferase RlmH [Bacteroidetes bacterium]|nr:MAG: 23S rRNA (pseudouridine(1915)-N(3))-methyltransferase RlmH [Bacteroidota bacterium]